MPGRDAAVAIRPPTANNGIVTVPPTTPNAAPMTFPFFAFLPTSLPTALACDTTDLKEALCGSAMDFAISPAWLMARSETLAVRKAEIVERNERNEEDVMP